MKTSTTARTRRAITPTAGEGAAPEATDVADDLVLKGGDFSKLGVNFVARILCQQRHVASAGFRVYFDIELRLTGRPPLVETIDSDEYEDADKFRKWLRRVGGWEIELPRGRGGLAKLRTAIQRASAPEEASIHDQTGWAMLDGAEHFLMPGAPVGPTSPAVALPTTYRGLAGYGFVELAGAELQEALALVARGLPAALHAEAGLPLLAFAFAPALHRSFGEDRRYQLFLRGTTGSGKTTASMLVQALWGAGFGEVPPLSWTSTPNAIEEAGFWAKDALLVVDDYKAGLVDKAGADRLLQNYADGTGRDRMAGEGGRNRSYWVRAHLLSTGEDAPEGQASGRARMLLVEYARDRDRRAAIAAVRAKAHLLPGAMRRFVAWLAEEPVGREALARDAFARRRDALASHPCLDGVPNADRVALNLALNAAAFDVLVAWLAAEGAIDGAEHADLLERYDGRALPALLATNAESVRSQAASRRYLERLAGLIASGEAALALGSEQAVADGVKELGWVQGDVVYLHPEVAFAAAGGEAALGATKHGLHQQLERDGCLVRRDKDQITVLVRRRRKGIRVLALHARALGLGIGAEPTLLPFPDTTTPSEDEAA